MLWAWLPQVVGSQAQGFAKVVKCVPHPERERNSVARLAAPRCFSPSFAAAGGQSPLSKATLAKP